jgi:predicted DNA-binding ribbon-helix-helix protein
MIKRSVSIKGHRTSIALESEFWAVLDTAASERGLSLPRLIGEIDRARLSTGGNLASALRVFALKFASDRDHSGVSDKAERRAAEHKLGVEP